jgi:hypothetical protein
VTEPNVTLDTTMYQEVCCDVGVDLNKNYQGMVIVNESWNWLGGVPLNIRLGDWNFLSQSYATARGANCVRVWSSPDQTPAYHRDGHHLGKANGQ